MTIAELIDYLSQFDRNSLVLLDQQQATDLDQYERPYIILEVLDFSVERARTGKSPHTIAYRGYEIDPVSDPYQTGAWNVCPLAKATHFRIYPPDEGESALDCAEPSLAKALLAVDLELGGTED